jgi:hypothetical protein
MGQSRTSTGYSETFEHHLMTFDEPSTARRKRACGSGLTVKLGGCTYSTMLRQLGVDMKAWTFMELGCAAPQSQLIDGGRYRIRIISLTYFNTMQVGG